MAKETVRVAGKVLQTMKQTFGQGDRKFSFLEASIQTGVASILEVRFTDDWPGDAPRAGDLLDIEVEVGGFSGRNGLSINYTAVSPHSDDFWLALLESHTVAA